MEGEVGSTSSLCNRVCAFRCTVSIALTLLYHIDRQAAREGKLDPVIGRDEEIRRFEFHVHSVTICVMLPHMAHM